MSEAGTTEKANVTAVSAATMNIAAAPHLAGGQLTTRRMMLDVLIALAPVVGMSIYVFGWPAVAQIALCAASCLAAEAIFTAMRGKPQTLGNLSAVVTGVILALSIPGSPPCPRFVGVIGSFTAVGVGKIIFGGLGQNIFNPAMVGRAFVMMAFPAMIGASGYVLAGSPDVVSQATPMVLYKQQGQVTGLWELFWGLTNGSLGETSAAACLLGGLYLCIRRTASWEIPAGVLAAAALLAGLKNLTQMDSQWTVLHHLFGGALMFGAFFIATDPVTSPLTPRGKFLFGACIGALVIVFRLFSGYPEGVMFAVLLMNSLVPLINRWMIPRPVGGSPPVRAGR